eukprot:TRINITY_DN357_c0_g1_i1.p1 TRINITY_DN357_c0_g1~~TRINITY_DN357_c0_g1_i1.p1  ORF type:complete len:666 (+),score=179.79 TRINITY_DN357_c0_g1_i1:95-2092(+)
MAMAAAPADATTQQHSDVFGNMTVGDVTAPGAVGCKVRPHDALGDLASALAASGRTAAVVVDMLGSLVALVTENDVMRFYWEGASPKEFLSDWLSEHGDEARASRPKLDRITVAPSTPLTRVAETMVNNAMSGDCACHHIIVADEEAKKYAVFSSLDMIEAICQASYGWGTSQDDACSDPDLRAPSTPERQTVSEVMKQSDSVITCSPSNTMKEVLKCLLMTQQNSALISDSHGIHGIVTPRDAIQAFADGVQNSVIIRDWLQANAANPKERMIESCQLVTEAEAAMMNKKLQHLVVVDPGTSEAVGSVSAMDIALITAVPLCAPLLRSARPKGPQIQEVLEQAWHRNTVCEPRTSLKDIATQMTSPDTASSSVTLEIASEKITCHIMCSEKEDVKKYVLVTEADVMKAFLDKFNAEDAVEDWLVANRGILPAYVIVSPFMNLSDAAAAMLRASAHGRHCHHLVVRGPGRQWTGVLSSLDIVRGLSKLCSPLDVARLGADSTTVSTVMKPISIVPRCTPSDTLKSVLSMLLKSGQGAALVMDETGTPCIEGVITPRCAMQALANGIGQGETVASWMRQRRGSDGPREVVPNLKLYDAALLMGKHGLHHLVVAKRPYCTHPIGIVSSLDIVRGISSIHSPTPFVSLEWLKACRGPAAASVMGHSSS